MKNINDNIFEFLIVLARVRAMFRDIHIFAENSGIFKKVNTTLNPFTSQNKSDFADNGTTLQLALDAELIHPPNSEHKALGASLLLRRRYGRWVLDAEIGWSGMQIGWDPIDSLEKSEEAIDKMFKDIIDQGEWVCLRYKDEVAKLVSQGSFHGNKSESGSKPSEDVDKEE